ncbi:MAG: ABC transporter ATP-binding protein [Acidimicrobiales bacterium]|nr:ABC transporter ATP-binding protein [Acidimicrobiales bacterium]
MSGLLLRVSAVSKSYGDHEALHEVDLDVAAGEICGLLGPNGAGKTSLVSIIAGLRSPDSGTVTVDGLDVTTDRRTRGLVGLAGQETAVYPTLSARANLELMGGLAGLGRREVATRIDEVAPALELDGLLDRKVRFLSGGEKRRVHTGMAMLHRPRLLMLDEPTTGVDVATRTRLLAAIRELAARDGCAVLYSTHYLQEIDDLGASVAVLDRGRMLARGRRDELVDRYASGFVELTFGGTTPEPSVLGSRLGRGDVIVVDSVVRIPTEHPGTDAAHILGCLGDLAHDLTAVELIRPSLEAVFLTLTGRSVTADAEPDVDLVGASGGGRR